MVDEDFVMGYACGYNDGIGSGEGSGGGLIIPEGTTPIYNVPILHNYVFTGTDFGLGTIDVNTCTFLNDFYSDCSLQYARNIITDKPCILPYNNPTARRKIAVAITKNGVAIGLIPIGATYYAAKSSNAYYRLIDGSFKNSHGNISVSKIENPEITTIVEEDDNQKPLFMYLEYDVVETTELYKINPSKTGTFIDSEGRTLSYYYYDEGDIDVYQGTKVTTNHFKKQIGSNLSMTTVKSTDYPDELMNVYHMNSFRPNVIWGTDIETIREFHLSLTTGLSG